MAGPLGPDDFASLIAACGPFESRPHLAVAVSGGADSLALALLAEEWARARGGRVTALTVDHGLRAAAAAEAAQVGDWLARRAIAHVTLRWTGTKPARGIQAAARAARYDLLLGWCRGAGVVHLLVAHHRGDQAETVRLRAARSSGDRGLAAMARVAPPPCPGPRWPRLLRPLLDVPKAALLETLRVRGQPWIEDPSNRDASFTRVAIRRDLETDAAAVSALLDVALAARRRQEAAEEVLLDFAPVHVHLYGGGYAALTSDWRARLSPAVASMLWARLLMTIGGSAYPPRGAPLDRLAAATLRPDFAGATLAGCRIFRRGGDLVVTREPAAARDVRPWSDGMLWDNRFLLTGSAAPGVIARRLGEAGWRLYRARDASGAELLSILPHPARLALPALYEGTTFVGLPQIIGIPALSDLGRPSATGETTQSARFAPPVPLSY